MNSEIIAYTFLLRMALVRLKIMSREDSLEFNIELNKYWGIEWDATL